VRLPTRTLALRPLVQALVQIETDAVKMDGRKHSWERGQERGRNETASTPYNLLEPSCGHYQTRLCSMKCGVILGLGVVAKGRRACREMVGYDFQCFDRVR